jgi:hypothetical protein
MKTWHAEVPPMLTWMTNGLVSAIANQARIRSADKQRAVRRAEKAAQLKKQHQHKPPSKH